MIDELITCKNCGTKNLETSDVCRNCGSILEKTRKIKKKKKININIKLDNIISFSVILISIFCMVFGFINSYKIINEGLFVMGSDSLKIKIFFLIESFSPVFYLIGIFLLIKNWNEENNKLNIKLLIIYLLGTIISLLPFFVISDGLFMVLELTSYNIASVIGIIYLELSLLYLFKCLLSIKKLNKKIIKIILIIFLIILIIISFILLKNLIQPSEYLFPDYE